jgi:hypothetical protein
MTTLESAMQAAERLRRADSGTEITEIYGEPYTHRGYLDAQHKQADDFSVVARWALSVLPKGDVPKALETPQHGQKVWYFDLGGDTVHESAIRVVKNMPHVLVYGSDDFWDTITPGGTPVFATEADARLALHYQKLQELIAAAAQAQQTGRERFS